MKFFILLKLFMGQKSMAQMLIAFELLIGLLTFYLCANMLYTFQVVDDYTEKYANIAVVDSDNPEQVAYAKANGTLFAQEKFFRFTNKNIFGSLNSLEFYNAVPLDLVEGTWFSGDFSGSDLVAVIPYSLKNEYKCGQIYSLSFREVGDADVFICGILSSDITLGNSDNAAFGDLNKTMLLYDRKGITHDIEPIGDTYAKLETVKNEELSALGIMTVGMNAELVQKRHTHAIAVPIIFASILFVLFTVGFIGEHSLSMVEREKMYAVQFVCGASPGLSFAVQACLDFVRLLAPFIISCVVAQILGLRLHLLGVIMPFAYLFLGISIITGLMLISFSKKSPINIIKRRFRS